MEENIQLTSNKRSSFWPAAIFLILILMAGYYLYSVFLKNPCKLPVKYAIGNVDPRFKISNSDLSKIADDATSRWNSEAGEQVLLYDSSAKLKINLVYDERQANVDKLNSEVANLDSSGNAIDSAKSKLESMITSYESDLNDYNSTVQYWNLHGGAPQEVYTRLQSEKANLDKRRSQINDYISLLNIQINDHNSNLGQLNNEISTDQNKIITSGLYYPADPKIDIFTFGNSEELRLVLMHELGHALSLGHDAIDTSIMYSILGAQNLSDPMLSSEDIQMFNSTCKSPIGFFQKLIDNFKNRFQPTPTL
ncbi:MAG: matrixin family metalloprotease [Patescibacteria group bacterium]